MKIKEYKKNIQGVETYNTELENYLNKYSIARKILAINKLSVFSYPKLSSHMFSSPAFDLSIDEIFMLAKKNKIPKGSGYDLRVLTSEDFSFKIENGININLIEACVLNDSEKDYDDYDDIGYSLNDIKKDLLKEEEYLFNCFVKDVSKKNGNYIICDTVYNAIEKIKEIKYNDIWILNSLNLTGVILAHSDIPMKRGIFTIKQEPCILKGYGSSEFVSFESIGIMLFKNNLTYIEIKGNENF